jgi:ATP-dependent helicase/DNAse subunit B
MPFEKEIRWIPFGFEDKVPLIERVLSELEPPDYSSVLYLTPSTRKARWLKHCFIRRFQKKYPERRVFIPPTFHSFGSLAKSLFLKQGLPYRLISEAGKEILLARLVEQLASFREFKRDTCLSLVGPLADFIKWVKSYLPDLTPPELAKKLKEEVEQVGGKKQLDLGLPERISRRLESVVEAYEYYQRTLKENGFVDEEDLLGKLPGLIAASADFNWLILDGFYDVTPLEEKAIEALVNTLSRVSISINWSEQERDSPLYTIPGSFLRSLEKKVKVQAEPWLDRTLSKKTPCLFQAQCKSREDEVKAIARTIKYLYREKPFALKRVLVTFPNMEAYAPLVRRIFAQYGILFNLSYGMSLLNSPVFGAVNLLLQTVVEGYPRQLFSYLLSSPFFNWLSPEIKEEIDWLSREAEIDRGKEDWLQSLRNLEKDVRDRSKSKLARQAQIEIKNAFQVISILEKKGSISDFNDRLYQVLDKGGFFERLERLAQQGREEAFKAWESLSEWLEELTRYSAVPLSTVEERLNLLQYWQRWRTLLARWRFWSKSKEEAGVQVLGILESRGLPFDLIFLGGLADEEFPGRVAKDIFLPESVKNSLGLPDYQKRFSLFRLSFLRLAHSAQQATYLSYPESDAEQKFLPSRFLKDLSGVESWPSFKGIFSNRELFPWLRSHFESFSLNVPKETLKFLKEVGLRGTPESCLSLDHFLNKPLNVTALETYKECPYKFFLQEVLKLRPLEEPKLVRESREWGLNIHQVMKLVFQKNPKGFDGEKDFIEALWGAGQEVFGWNGQVESSQVLAKWRFEAIIKPFVEENLELFRRGYQVLKVEEYVEGELGGLRIKGRVDRVDLLPSGQLVVIDYKTGGSNSPERIRRVNYFQVALYAWLLRKRGELVGQGGYFILKPGDCYVITPGDQESFEKEIKKNVRLALESIERLKHGDFSKGKGCYICLYKLLCHGGESG